MGASSTSARSTPSSMASSSDVTSRLSSSKSSPASSGIAVSTCSSDRAEQLVELVLLDDDRLDRQAGRELDLVESRAGWSGRRWRRTAACRASPAAGRGACAAIFSLTSRTDLEVGLDGVEVEQRGAELLRRGDGDLAGVGQVVLDEVADDADAALACARQTASSIAASPTRPSATRRWGRPCRPPRGAATFAATSFISGHCSPAGLGRSLGTRIVPGRGRKC